MKQRITVEQLQELTEEQKQKLRDWWEPITGDYVEYVNYDEPVIIEAYYPASNPVVLELQDITDQEYCYPIKKEDCLPLLSIRQMIELLSYKGLGHIKPVIDCDVITTVEGWDVPLDSGYYGKGRELCNALWSAVKEVLSEG